MTAPMSLFQGDSSELLQVRPNIADPAEVISGDWVCTTKLVDVDKNEIVAARTETTKTDDELHFVVSLSPTDTEAVTVGDLPVRVYWVIQMTNNVLSPAYNREKHLPVIVKKQAIT